MHHKSTKSLLLAPLIIAALVTGSCSDSTSPSGVSLPDYTVISGSVTENSDGSISVHPDSTTFVRFDDPLSGDTARMTVEGRFDGTHIDLILYGNDQLYQSWDAFMIRTPSDEFFVNLVHPTEGSLMNTTLPGPYAVGDDFSIRFEVDDSASAPRARIWAPGDGFEDEPVFDSDDYMGGTLTASGEMYSGLILTGATIRRVEITPIP